MNHAPALTPRAGQLVDLDALAAIPKEEIWLASQKSVRTRRAYRPLRGNAKTHDPAGRLDPDAIDRILRG